MNKQNLVLDAALSYAGRGWPVVPCHSVTAKGVCSCSKGLNCGSAGKHPRTENGLKDASTSPDAIQRWWRRWPTANVGVTTGSGAGFFVIDVDGDEGLEALGQLELAHDEPLPKTVCAATGSGGRHFFFRYPEGISVRNSAGKLGNHLDTRGEGGYIVASPSVNANGAYSWIQAPEETAIADAPAWLLNLIVEQKAKKAADPVGDAIPEGRRNSELASIAGTFRRRGLSEAEIYAALEAVNQARCTPPLPDAEVRSIAQSIAEYPTADFGLSDMGNGQRLRHYHGDKLRFVPAWKKWLIWDGIRWKADDQLHIQRLAKDTVRRIYLEAAEAEDEARRKSIAQWARTSESEQRLKAMIGMAESELTITPDALDSDPMLLCCANGYIDLRTGELLPARQDNHITKTTGIPFDPKADCPLWRHFLERVLPDSDLRDYIQKAVGYSLTADVTVQCLFFAFGTGANGKSVFSETLARLLGEYFRKTRSETLMITRGGGIPNDIAALVGSRLVTVSEISSGQRLDEGLVKDLTGGNTLTARFLNREFFSFKAGFKLWMHGNHKPKVYGKDEGIWRRIRLLPFVVRIPEAERDHHLTEKLESELPGILAWAVKGCLAWQAEEELREPACVREAVSEYRREQDGLADFLEFYCVFERGASVTKKELWESYQLWADEAGEAAFESQRIFNLEIREREGVKEARGTGGVKEWRGIRLRNADEPMPPELNSDSSDRSDREFGIFLHEGYSKKYSTNSVTPVTPVTNERKSMVDHCPNCQEEHGEWRYERQACGGEGGLVCMKCHRAKEVAEGHDSFKP